MRMQRVLRQEILRNFGLNEFEDLNRVEEW